MPVQRSFNSGGGRVGAAAAAGGGGGRCSIRRVRMFQNGHRHRSARCFDDNHDNQLVSLVQSHPFLYQITHPDYTNHVAKENAWISIAEILQRSISECKVRWRTIRDSYKKNRKMLLTGRNVAMALRSKYNTDCLKFLDEYLFERVTECNSKLSRTALLHMDDTIIKEDEMKRSMVYHSGDGPDDLVTVSDDDIKTESILIYDDTHSEHNDAGVSAAREADTEADDGGLIMAEDKDFCEANMSEQESLESDSATMPMPILVSERPSISNANHSSKWGANAVDGHLHNHHQYQHHQNLIFNKNISNNHIQSGGNGSSSYDDDDTTFTGYLGGRKLPKLRHHTDRQSSTSDVTEVPNLRREQPTQNQQHLHQHQDPVDAFFSSMASIVKTFPPERVAEVRMRVCSVVSEVEISHIREVAAAAARKSDTVKDVSSV